MDVKEVPAEEVVALQEKIMYTLLLGSRELCHGQKLRQYFYEDLSKMSDFNSLISKSLKTVNNPISLGREVNRFEPIQFKVEGQIK